MGKREFFKKLVSTTMAVAMAASMCFVSVPAYKAEAATKKVSVAMTQSGFEKEVSLKVGKKMQLRVTKNGSYVGRTAVTYKVTSGKSVAKVSKTGVITAKKKGDAEITIKDKNSDYSTIVYVEVTSTGANAKSKKYKIDRIWLDRASITLEVGEGYHASCFCSGEDKDRGRVIWGCDDSNIVTVYDGGYIRAVGHGSTRVYATKGGHTAAMMVNVN